VFSQWLDALRIVGKALDVQQPPLRHVTLAGGGGQVCHLPQAARLPGLKRGERLRRCSVTGSAGALPRAPLAACTAPGEADGSGAACASRLGRALPVAGVQRG